MFTLERIHEAFYKVKSGADFPRYVQDLKALGVLYYENFVADGTTIYVGENGHQLADAPKYPSMHINAQSSQQALKHAIAIHQKGETDYPTFCLQAAAAGVEKWTTNTKEMTVAYSDKSNTVLLVEPIPH